MEQYLGVKLVKASEEISRQEYCNYIGWKLPENENGEDRVYLIEYEKDENSKQNHPDHEGYISMSPKDVFEKAYRKIKLTIPQIVTKYDWQDRVVKEAEDLLIKTFSLDQFIEYNIAYTNLSSDEQIRLKQQLMAMQYYLTILIERIENF